MKILQSMVKNRHAIRLATDCRKWNNFFLKDMAFQLDHSDKLCTSLYAPLLLHCQREILRECFKAKILSLMKATVLMAKGKRTWKKMSETSNCY